MLRPDRIEAVARREAQQCAPNRGERERLRGTAVAAVAERGDELNRGKRRRVGEPPTVPAPGIPAIEARYRAAVRQWEQRRYSRARLDTQRRVTDIELHAAQHIAGHDRALREPGRLERALLREGRVACRHGRPLVGVFDEV